MSTAITFGEIPAARRALELDLTSVGPGAPCHCVIAVEAGRCTKDRMQEAIAAAGSGCLRVTVAVVADPIDFVVLFAPMGGMAPVTTSHLQLCHAQLRSQALDVATIAAREAIDAVPVHIPAQHRVASSWREVLRMADGCDVLVVAAAPSRRRDRRRLRRHGLAHRMLDVPASRAVLAQ